MVECGGLENRCAERHRGFESLSLRHSTRYELRSPLAHGRPFGFGEFAEENLQSVECLEPVEGQCFIYILFCSNGSFYVGHTKNVGKRLALHMNGDGASHTRRYRPLSLVFTEGPLNSETAIKREIQLKKWSRDKKMALLRGDQAELKRLAKSRE